MSASQEPASRIPVVIGDDGSAVIDGVPVPLVGGESVDVAVLDTLHGYARSRNSVVTAAISDPAADHVAIVEVAPDGSSQLVEERRKEPGETAGTPGTAAPGKPAASVAPAGPAGRGPRQSDDEYETPGLLGRPAVIGAVAVAVTLLVVVPLIVLGSRAGGDTSVGAADRRSESPAVLPPQPTATSSSPRPHAGPGLGTAPEASPSASASRSTPAGRKPGASPAKTKKAGPDPTRTDAPHPAGPSEPRRQTAAEPRRQTAAEAVSKLAAGDPGRHICYRVYLDKDGWGKPVCDGATAGRVKTKQKIKAINTATSGTKGTASNAWVRKEEWKTPWSSGVDGVDVYIGSTRPKYPYILGFVINVGDGAVCQNAAVDGRWGGLACDRPTGQAPGNFIWGGTQDDSLWLQAVRFTV